jgi:hypothetical protein
MGRILGIILIVVGVAICGLTTLFIGSGVATNALGTSGAVLGIALFGGLPLLLFAGVGAFLFSRGQSEEKELAEIRKKERLLGMITAQGQVSLGTIMIQQKMTREEVQNDIYDLVNQGLFSGYVDWTTMTFYSKDASEVGSTKCPNCGGVREVAGKGIVKCPYCGVMLFIPAA